ncbi:MAG: hypothetical protein DCF19_15995 [Pseudanabaena frigida]|uniref:Class I SAM-dependent methyltransferase n=1 Tax=Pseudanabaena frigida TaxID=945775 RepID=A0A2W4W0S1_9CYAN|nr:MAG: hypothetical protein DCF19_15995 [Pseudanabaena frigida]
MTRSESARRSNYHAYAPPEEFIVPLLKTHIEEVLSKYLKPLESNKRVLDVGCGGQPFRKALEELGYKYMGIDISQNSNGTVDIICEIDKALPDEIIELGSFDLIFCTEVMEHVADWNMAFSNFSKLLNSGGKLFITCPHFYQLHEAPYDFWRPTPFALQYFTEKHNFRVLHQENAGDAWDVLGTLLASVYSLPVSQRFRDRLLNRFVKLIKEILFNILRDRKLQNSVQLKGLVYMSNIFLCQKN